MFAFIVKELMKSQKYHKIVDVLCGNFMFENVSYAQNSEDVVIDYLLGKELHDGLYVDVGAHHPIRFSNTVKLYSRGWHGIDIDPLPNCAELFRRYRPKDIALNVGISSQEGMMTYFQFEEPAYNTFNVQRAKKVVTEGWSPLIAKKKVRVVTLKRVFERYVKAQTIDVLTIDVETMELDVLQSNDWERYRPRLVVMESIVSLDKDLTLLNEDPAIRFLTERGYRIAAKVCNAVFLMAAEP